MSNDPTVSPTGNSQPDPIADRINAYEKIVADCVDNQFPLSELPDKLKDAGASPAEAEDYCQQAVASLRILQTSQAPQPPADPSATQTSGGTTGNSAPPSSPPPAADDAIWKDLRAKVMAVSQLLDDQSMLSGTSGSKPVPPTNQYSIPSIVLQGAPHLQRLTNTSLLDKHILQTWELRALYSTDKALEGIVNSVPLQATGEPLPRPIWKDIIRDFYVNFEKIHAYVQYDFDQKDDFKEFLGDYVVTKRDSINARLPITNEAEWLRVFSAWEAAVLVVYPHRQDELSAYKSQVLRLFHSTPSCPAFAISFDAHIRTRYAKNPFRLDDRLEQHESFLAQVLRASQGSAPAPAKRAAPSSGGPKAKRVCMGSAANAALSTEPWTAPEIATNLSSPSASNTSKDRQILRAMVEEAAAGPRRFEVPKKRGVDSINSSDMPQRYKRGFVWNSQSSSNISPSALYTETAPPLPSPPQHLLNDPIIQAALHAAGDNIKVETPFNVDRFELLLRSHPNRPFVDSVLKGLREGFWPLDQSEWNIDRREDEEAVRNYSTTDIDLDTIRAFRDKEMSADRWSQPFKELSPGMKVSPMFVVWQSEKGRVVTDHSASGLNDGIPKSEAKVSYDDMRHFGQVLHDAREKHNGDDLVLFKSDVASAFLNLPAHPIWQLRQVVTIDEFFHIVRRLVFGNRASPRIWCAVSGLMCWIANKRLGILYLSVYMDDYFGWDRIKNLVRCEGRLIPKNQALLLQLWTFLGCPFEWRKQEHGQVLKIIGFWVDITKGSISLHPDSVANLVAKTKTFLQTPRPVLRDWQRLSGHINWLFNVMPLGRPALCEVYKKIAEKSNIYRPMYLNSHVHEDLEWLVDLIPRAIGVRLVDNMHWNDSDADMIMWTDAALHKAISFVYSNKGFIYQLAVPTAVPNKVQPDIMFEEQLAILCAVYHAATLCVPPKRLLIYSDNLPSVDVLNTFATHQPLHNAPLRAIATILMTTGIDLKVRHIRGEHNVRADMLSRLMIDEYHRKFPADSISAFEPPRFLFTSRWSEIF
ncbi:hypothetical protein ONZ45_g5144 [Pleurotus djamor]|nr:hypothetical protein ONZ45_g5144 [Pleurotus djamor]